MAVALVRRLFGRQRRSLCLAASVPGFLLSGISPWIIKEISEESWPFCLDSCFTHSSRRTVKFVMLMVKLNSVRPHGSGFVSFVTGSPPSGHKPAENYESTIPLILKGEDPRPLSQLWTRVGAPITRRLTSRLCFPQTVNKDGAQKRGRSVSILCFSSFKRHLLRTRLKDAKLHALCSLISLLWFV